MAWAAIGLTLCYRKRQSGTSRPPSLDHCSIAMSCRQPSVNTVTKPEVEHMLAQLETPLDSRSKRAIEEAPLSSLNI